MTAEHGASEYAWSLCIRSNLISTSKRRRRISGYPLCLLDGTSSIVKDNFISVSYKELESPTCRVMAAMMTTRTRSRESRG
jgi:hypothetical protein